MSAVVGSSVGEKSPSVAVTNGSAVGKIFNGEDPAGSNEGDIVG